MIKEGHFILTSGLHSDTYFEKFDFFGDPSRVSLMCRNFRFDVDVVVGPAVGGMIIAFETARQLGVPAVYVEKVGKTFELKRGQTLKRGARVLIVDDVLTTGSSIHKIIQVLEEFPVSVAQIAVFVDRSDDVTFPFPLYSIIKQKTNIWEPSSCPICTIK